MSYEWIYRLVTVLIPAFACFFAAKGIIHYFQLESYQFPGYYHTLNRNPVHSYLPGVLTALTATLAILLLPNPAKLAANSAPVYYLVRTIPFLLIAAVLGRL